MRGEFLDVDGARLYYFAAGTRGAGDPVLLVHGFPTSGLLWSGLLPDLPPGHRVVVVDLLGHGRSDRPDGADVSVAGHARRMLRILDLLAIPRATVIGHDVGGAIALAMAVAAPARVGAVGVIAGAGLDAPGTLGARILRRLAPVVARMPGSMLTGLARAELERGYADAPRGAHALERHLLPFDDARGARAFAAHLRALDGRWHRSFDPAGVTVPVTLVAGRDDPFHPVAAAERLRDRLPHATLHVLDDERHFLPEESPRRVARCLAPLFAAAG